MPFTFLERDCIAGQEIKDADFAPTLVVVPPGSFMMGSPDDEPERSSWEEPQHEVWINYHFAVSKYLITFAQWDAYADMVEGAYRPDDYGWGRGNRPVINVSWEDAQGYVQWLRTLTGKPYRLLSEAEWEYACRAGSTTAYSTGESITHLQAHFANASFQTVEVGSYPPNNFGLYDMHGNVWEWVDDVWHDDYHGAPCDGSAWLVGGDAERRVLRGGAWYSPPKNLRSADRDLYAPDIDDSGFRIAMTLV